MSLFWERLVASGDVGTLIHSMDGKKFAHCHCYIIIPIFLFILHHSVLGFPPKSTVLGLRPNNERKVVMFYEDYNCRINQEIVIFVILNRI